MQSCYNYVYSDIDYTIWTKKSIQSKITLFLFTFILVSSIPSFNRASFDNDDDAIIEEEESEELKQDNIIKYSNSIPEITVQLQDVRLLILKYH